MLLVTFLLLFIMGSDITTKVHNFCLFFVTFVSFVPSW